VKHIIIIGLILFFATSCKKKTTVVIQAQDYITGNGSAYAGKEYAVAESWTPFQEAKSEIVATGYLDANGQASFVLKMKNNRKYILGVSEPDNICYGGLVQHYLEHDKNNSVNFKYAYCSNLKINFNNVNCFDNTDLFKFYYEGRQIPGKEGLNGSLAKEATGCYTYENPNFSETPAGSYFYRWEIIRNGSLTIVYDTITLVKSQYYIYDVDY
jgi:membrane-bound inhibitor of C-type lysozyme